MDFDISLGNRRNDRFICLSNFCQSSGFCRRKFSSNKISSLYFMAPERISGDLPIDKESIKNANKVDLWSVGVLIYLLVFGKVPFEGETYSRLVKNIKAGVYKNRKNEFSGI